MPPTQSYSLNPKKEFSAAKHLFPKQKQQTTTRRSAPIFGSKTSKQKSSMRSVQVNLLLVCLTWSSPLLATVEASSNRLLSVYDQQASSSAFGEPIFRLEPQGLINLVNTKGTTILCLASGSPRPKISWLSSGVLDSAQPFSSDQATNAGEPISVGSSRLVGNITNLRQISQNGAALRLLPFSESQYRQDVHSTEYKCVASNHIATIHSRSVLIQTGE